MAVDFHSFSMRKFLLSGLFLTAVVSIPALDFDPPGLLADDAALRASLVRVADLNVGETQEVELCNGRKVSVELLNLKETRDSVRSAVRRAEVAVEVDGRKIKLVSSNYNLPT